MILNRFFFLRFFFVLLAICFLIRAEIQFAHAEGSDDVTNTSPLTASAKLQPSTIEAGGTAEVIIEMELAKHYRAYLDRFKLAIESPDDLKLDHFKITPVIQFMDTFSKKMKDGIENKATMRALIEFPTGTSIGNHSAKLKLTYQACTTDHCLFPKSIFLDVPFAISGGTSIQGSGAKFEPKSETVVEPHQGGEFERALGQGTLFALAVVFGMGFLTSLTPCIYPMIPITLAVLGARTRDQGRMKGFGLSFVYVLGIAFTYSLLGVAAAKTGALFGAALSNIYVVTAIALLFVTMGLSMYGAFELQVPAFIRDKIGTAKTGTGFGGAFATGLIAGVVASPCVGPVLVSILTYIAQTQNLVLGFLFLFTFAMGMGVLFIVLGTSSALLSSVPRAGKWMEMVKFVFGTIMVVMALYYVKPLYPAWLFHFCSGLAALLIASAYGAFDSNEGLTQAGRMRKGAMLATFFVGVALLSAGILSKAGVVLPAANLQAANGEASTTFPKLAWKPYSDESLQTALKEGKPILIDFYADWCEACKKLEQYTFVDPRIREASEQFALFKVDATTFDAPGISELRERYKVMGLPTMIFYDHTGRMRRDLTVTGFEDADAFLSRMKSAMSQSAEVAERSLSSEK